MAATPPDSRLGSPAPRQPRRQLEEEPRKQDKNYRRYASAIERALSSFDPAKLEWPDYISFLGRLLKAIQSHPSVVETLPHKFPIANRLSQCLKPSLPSGVHQKALEVYDCIFALIGKQTLAADLSVYLPGLSGVLGFASLSLRPAFLSLIETYIVPLRGAQLRPALRALILALLPGLEEENGEEFERTLTIVDDLREAVRAPTQVDTAQASASTGDEYFWQCFCLACISSSSRRQGALAFLTRRLPSLAPLPDSRPSGTTNSAKDGATVANRLLPDSEATITPEPGLLVRCFVSGLEDEQILTQRGFLDLLLSHLPLNSPALVYRAPQIDLVRIVGAATTVVARRDMSLNRRLWSWFLGPEVESTSDQLDSPLSPVSSRQNVEVFGSTGQDYFSRYGAEPLTKSILQMLSQAPIQPTQRARPFRICLSLMDRWEVGGKLVPQIFLPAMSNVFDYQSTPSRDDFQDVLRSASSFFDGVESGVIWGQLAELAFEAITHDEKSRRTRSACLTEFVLQHFNVREDDMVSSHIPLVTLLLLQAGDQEEACQVEALDKRRDRLEQAYPLLDILVSFLPAYSLTAHSAGLTNESKHNLDVEADRNLVNSIRSFYHEDKGTESGSNAPLSPQQLSLQMLLRSSSILMRALTTQEFLDAVVPRSTILTALLARIQVPQSYDYLGLVNALQAPLRLEHHNLARPQTEETKPISFPVIHAVASVIVTLVSVDQNASWQRDEAFLTLVNTLVQRLWDHLSPSCPIYHLEAVRCIWQVEDLLSTDNSVEASIASVLAQPHPETQESIPIIEHARRFAILWTHTNPAQSQPGQRPNIFKSRTSVASNAMAKASSNTDFQERLYRPLLLLLDLGEDNPELEDYLRTWLDRLPNASRVFQVLVSRVRSSRSLPTESLSGSDDSDMLPQTAHRDTRSECLYYLQRLLKMLRSTSSSHIWRALTEKHDSEEISNTDEEDETILTLLTETCLGIVSQYIVDTSRTAFDGIDQSLQLTSLSLIQVCSLGPSASGLQQLNLETRLIKLLRRHLTSTLVSSSIQAALLETTLATLKARVIKAPPIDRVKGHRRVSSTETLKPIPARRNTPVGDVQDLVPLDSNIATELTKCLQEGLESPSSINVLENWVQFLTEVLPLLSSTLFQSVIPLVETLCGRIRQAFQGLNASFTHRRSVSQSSPEPGLVALLNGLQSLLATAHDRLSLDESNRNQSRTPEPPQGFFGNVVSGVFAGEMNRGRTPSANTRLTVILCFQDALRICLSIWSWGAYGGMQDTPDPTCLASFAYVSQRLRNQTRRMLDRMFAVEGLECLETLIVAWTHQGISGDKKATSPTISLLHVLDASRPKQTMPTLFNSIYSRTSPSSIESTRVSTLTSDITEVQLAQFLLNYTRSLDDDAMDEIWTDCMTFLRDVLGNPLPHSQVLPLLLQFLVTLAEKVDKTNFGEQRKMRKELGDLFLRLLSATFTTRQTTGPQSEADSPAPDASTNGILSKRRDTKRKTRYADLTDILVALIPRLSTVLPDTDRLINAVAAILTNITTPVIHAKTFPDNVRSEHLTILYRLTAISSAQKLWRKDLSDTFLHPRLFTLRASLQPLILPLAQTLTTADKDRIPDLLSRLNAPTSAGIMFGVGATTARTDADKKTQLLLRRLALLTLASTTDIAVPHLDTIDEKLSELLLATPASSPSSTTRADLFLLLRALVLSTTPQHLAPLWSIITTELQRAISSALPRSSDWDLYNVPSLLQACKLLDLLLLLLPEEFQLHEWLFVTDSVEAVYRPAQWEPVALVDELAEELNSLMPPLQGEAQVVSPLVEESSTNTLDNSLSAPTPDGPTYPNPDSRQDNRERFKHPLLTIKDPTTVTAMDKEEFVRRHLRPFFARLSMHAYERVYGMKGVDMEGLRMELVGDVFDGGTVVG